MEDDAGQMLELFDFAIMVMSRGRDTLLECLAHESSIEFVENFTNAAIWAAKQRKYRDDPLLKFTVRNTETGEAAEVIFDIRSSK